LVDVSCYFHIPFCTKKCPYCHFYTVPNKDIFKDVLKEAIVAEWQIELPKLWNKKIVSIYFGGGTPTLFAPHGISSILKEIKKSNLDIDPNCEITIEANPEDCNQNLLEQLLFLGINRISIGIQSLNDASLAILGRGHVAHKAKEAIFQASAAGFQNISIDLMYDLPSQTEASWEETLHQINDLPITHLSLYNLTIEPHTSFYKKKSLILPDQETSKKMLDAGIEAFKNKGLERYEISAFAKEGYRSRHNTGYWIGRPFLGFGPSAFSYWNGKRYRNTMNLQQYANLLKKNLSPVDFQEELPHPKNVKERFLVHLRLLEGLNINDFSSLPKETYLSINKWIADSYLIQEGNRIRLSDKGLLFYDEIAADII